MSRHAVLIELREPARVAASWVAPAVVGASLFGHLTVLAVLSLLPAPSQAITSTNQLELELVVPLAPPQSIVEEPPPPPEEPEPEAPVVRPAAIAERPRVAPRPPLEEPRPEEAPPEAEPPPPAPVLTAERADGAPDPDAWTHPAGEEGGRLGGTPGGQGTGGPVAGTPEGVVDARPRGISRAELRRRVLAYIRGTLSTFVNGRLDYPLAARRNHMEGVVVLRLRLADDGEILSVRLSQTSGHDVLDRAALARVSGLRTMPAPPSEIPWDDGLEIPLPVTYHLQ